ncbi:MAG: nicotinate (nicotinamide) nucleotide adenylyltransferase [Spirochaetaceae bacterium]|nr:nicotinate (nicotinamide) nucleotide adenylyltransferase [Spirochaetaceae bacterium]
MRLAILGGSFNPIHIGHLLLADAVLSSLSYDRIMLIPAFQSPLKDESRGAGPRDRLDMLLASVTADPRFGVDDCELRREGISYTIDTVEDIARRYRPDGRPGLILGDDLAANFHRWKGAEELASRTDIIVAHRTSREELPFPYAHTRLDNPIIEVSSGSVREKIQGGQGWEYLVPPGARFIIQDRALYGVQRAADEEGFWSTAFRLEGELVHLVNFRRFIHSRNTALMARDLALAYGLAPDKAYLAGISHDICKGFPPGEIRRMALRDGKGLSRLERKNPALLHGRAGAVYLQERCQLTDSGVLEAVAVHTTGSEYMGPLARVLYIADKLEWGRENAGDLRSLLDRRPLPDLDEFFTSVLNDSVAYLDSREITVSGSTRRLLARMGKKGKR